MGILRIVGVVLNYETLEALAKVRNLPFDRLRVNGLRLKLFSFSVRGELVEPQKNTFARASIVNLSARIKGASLFHSIYFLYIFIGYAP